MKILFVCIGNVCRSQMAEGFARAHALPGLTVASAGVHPGMGVDPVSVKLMAEKSVDISEHFPKSYKTLLKLGQFDTVVNMSGLPLTETGDARMLTWDVEDPYLKPEELHRQVRDEIEQRVANLLADVSKLKEVPKPHQAAVPRSRIAAGSPPEAPEPGMVLDHRRRWVKRT